MQKIGFMQGRLLPKYNGQFQCHPKDWLEEFRLANSNQYHYIEWIIDKQSKDFNPLLNDQGRLMILKASNEYQIKINSICADILLQNIIKDEIDAKYWLKNIISIINAAYIIKCKIIVVPLIERMTLKNKNLRKVIIDIFKKLLPLLREKRIKIAFEMDLNPKEVISFLGELNSELFGINYDSGNSAACGFNIEDEFNSYKSRIINFHIKDRFYMGSSTILGRGDTNLNYLADQISNNFPEAPIILQAFRDEKGLEITNLQRDWFINLIMEKKKKNQ